MAIKLDLIISLSRWDQVTIFEEKTFFRCQKLSFHLPQIEPAGGKAHQHSITLTLSWRSLRQFTLKSSRSRISSCGIRENRARSRNRVSPCLHKASRRSIAPDSRLAVNPKRKRLKVADFFALLSIMTARRRFGWEILSLRYFSTRKFSPKGTMNFALSKRVCVCCNIWFSRVRTFSV